MRTQVYDVAVVGGGPVGSRVAGKLAEMGHSVVVLEKEVNLRAPVCCTGIISQECVNRFNIDSSLICRQAYGARFFPPSGELFSLRRRQPQACVVDRAAFNAALARQAYERGVEYRLGTPVSDIIVEDDRVRIESGGGGASKCLDARALVIAAGFASGLPERLGLGRVGDFVIGAQAEVETNGIDEVEVYLGQKIAPGFFAWLVPTTPKRALAGLMSRRRADFYLRRLLASLESQGKIVSANVEPRYRGIPLKPPSRTYTDRIIVVGSAAGQAKPTTGGGIYYGLVCADIAADTLHRALRSDDLSAKYLARYEKAWKNKLGKEIKTGYWCRQFFERLSDRQMDSIAWIIRSNGIDKAVLEADDLSFDWHAGSILKLLGHRALARTFAQVRFPFPSGRD